MNWKLFTADLRSRHLNPPINASPVAGEAFIITIGYDSWLLHLPYFVIGVFPLVKRHHPR